MLDSWEPPGWLPADAAELWPALVDDLRQRQRLDRANPALMAMYCQTLVQYQRCTDALEAEGQVLVLRNDKGVVIKQEVAPEASLQIRLMTTLRALAKDMGLTGPIDNGKEETGKEAGDGPRERRTEAARNRLAARLRAIGGGGDGGRN